MTYKANVHNHVDHEIRDPGKCPACDLHYVPENLRAIRQDGAEIPVEAKYNGLTKKGEHEWVIVMPAQPIAGFKGDTELPEGHVLSIVSPQYAVEQVVKDRMSKGGPESGPEEGEQDEHGREDAPLGPDGPG